MDEEDWEKHLELVRVQFASLTQASPRHSRVGLPADTLCGNLKTNMDARVELRTLFEHIPWSDRLRIAPVWLGMMMLARIKRYVLRVTYVLLANHRLVTGPSTNNVATLGGLHPRVGPGHPDGVCSF